jgi:hypothetical protein
MSGGLGNQLFQASLALAISHQTGQKVGLDLDAYNYSGRTSNRFLEIEQFVNNAFFFYDSSLRASRILCALSPNSIVLKSYKRKEKDLRTRRFYAGQSIQIEKQLIFDVSINLQEDSYFVGSYISPKYWGGFRDIVLDEIRKMFWSNNRPRIDQDPSSLSVHIRRGDYISNPKTRSFHGLCGIDYYLSSVEDLVEKYPDIENIELFSDDLFFAHEFKNKISHLKNMVVVNSCNNPSKTLSQMSQSNYFIGSNSTFSWWASVLNSKRISVLPSKWFLDESIQVEKSDFFIGDIVLSEIPLE